MTEPVLIYAIGPKTLQVGSTDAALQIMISPKVAEVDEDGDPWDEDGVSSGSDVFLKDITVSVDIGDGSADLTQNTKIGHSDPIGWSLVKGRWKFGVLKDWTVNRTSPTGGEFIFTATTPIKIEPNSLVMLDLSGIEINSRGTTTVHITENTCSDPQGAVLKTGKTDEDLVKVVEFHIGQIWPNYQHVAHGGRVTLNWLSSDGTDCSVHWKQFGKWQSKRNLPHSSALLEGGALAVDDLTEDTTFILKTDSQAKNAQPDDCTVYVMEPMPKMSGFKAVWHNNTVLYLEWKVENYANAKITYGPDETILPGSTALDGNTRFTPTAANPLPSRFKLNARKPASIVKAGENEWDTWTLESKYSKTRFRHAPMGAKSRPWSVAFSDDGKHVLVPALAEDVVRVFDVRTLVEHQNSPISVGITPKSIAVSPGSISRVFVDDSDEYSVIVIDGVTFKNIKKVVVSHKKYTGDPTVLRMQPGGSQVFVLDYRHKKVTAINANTLDVDPKSVYSLGYIPRSMAASNEKIFVIGQSKVNLTVIDTKTFKPIKGSPFDLGSGKANKVVVSPDGSQLCISFPGSSALRVFHADTCEEIPNSPVPLKGRPDGISYSPDGARIFVADSRKNISILDSKTLKHVTCSPIKLDYRIHNIGVSPDGVFLFAIDVSYGVLNSYQADFTPSSNWGPKL